MAPNHGSLVDRIDGVELRGLPYRGGVKGALLPAQDMDRAFYSAPITSSAYANQPLPRGET